MINIIRDIDQGTDEWFSLRCGSLGASVVKNACAGGQGKVRKKLAYQLAAERITGQKYSIAQNAAMAWGVRYESEAREVFSFSKELKVEEVALIKNNAFPRCHISPDGLCADGNGLEIKCPQAATHVQYLVENRLPLDYKPQVMFSMILAELPAWWFVSYYPGLRPLILLVERDEKYCSDLLVKVENFLEELREIEEKIK